MSLVTSFIYLAIYSLLGWILESIYCSILFKKLTNRGFLTGPFCPIYGFGSIFILLFISFLPQNIFIVSLGGLFISTLLEYLTSVVMEKIFKTRW